MLYDVNSNALWTDSYRGKKLSILGDSISTFVGYIPAGNACYYYGNNCGVPTVNDTWWMKLINALGMVLEVNNSWSGSQVTTTWGTDSAGCMTRCQQLGEDPDVIIVYMGINDFNREVGLGTYKGEGAVPSVTTTFREAYAIMLDKMMTAYPDSEIWCATLPPCEHNGAKGAPERNDNDVPLLQYNQAIQEIALLFGAKVLDHAQCGMTYENMSIYTGDWDSGSEEGLHPNAAGMSLIANNDIRQIDDFCRVRY